MPSLTVEKFFSSRHQDFELTLLNTDAGMRKVITNPELFRPGLALTGFFERFASKRVQILGETEVAYVSQLSSDRLAEVSRRLFEHDIPMVIVTKGIIPPDEFCVSADHHNTAVFSSRLTTAQIFFAGWS